MLEFRQIFEPGYMKHLKCYIKIRSDVFTVVGVRTEGENLAAFLPVPL